MELATKLQKIPLSKVEMEIMKTLRPRIAEESVEMEKGFSEQMKIALDNFMKATEAAWSMGTSLFDSAVAKSQGPIDAMAGAFQKMWPTMRGSVAMGSADLSTVFVHWCLLLLLLLLLWWLFVVCCFGCFVAAGFPFVCVGEAGVFRFCFWFLPPISKTTWLDFVEENHVAPQSRLSSSFVIINIRFIISINDTTSIIIRSNFWLQHRTSPLVSLGCQRDAPPPLRSR